MKFPSNYSLACQVMDAQVIICKEVQFYQMTFDFQISVCHIAYPNASLI